MAHFSEVRGKRLIFFTALNRSGFQRFAARLLIAFTFFSVALLACATKKPAEPDEPEPVRVVIEIPPEEPDEEPAEPIKPLIETVSVPGGSLIWAAPGVSAIQTNGRFVR